VDTSRKKYDFVYNFIAAGKNITEVINVREKMNQLFKDKILLGMMVLGLLTIVAAAGAVRFRQGNDRVEENPYLEVPETGGYIVEQDPHTEEKEEKQDTEEKKEDIKVAGSSDAEYSRENRPKSPNSGTSGSEDSEAASKTGAKALALDFKEADKLAWPVTGNILLDYSMDATIYFPTLDQYKCNPALIIQSDVSSPVQAPADARVTECGANEEIGNYVVMDLGNEYTAVCGQLKDVKALEGEYLCKGDIIGYVAEPTKYYATEGNNVFFELKQGGQPVDALDYLE